MPPRQEPGRREIVGVGVGSVSGCVGPAARFRQEPSAALRLVDQRLEQTRGSAVLEFVAQFMRLAHRGGAVLVVGDEVVEHVGRIEKFGFVVFDARKFGDFANRQIRRRPQRSLRARARGLSSYDFVLGGRRP